MVAITVVAVVVVVVVVAVVVVVVLFKLLILLFSDPLVVCDDDNGGDDGGGVSSSTAFSRDNLNANKRRYVSMLVANRVGRRFFSFMLAGLLLLSAAPHALAELSLSSKLAPACD